MHGVPYCHIHKIDKKELPTSWDYPSSWFCEECFKENYKEYNVAEITSSKRSKYHREVKPGVYIDVYDVLTAFNVTCPAIGHAVKKLLAPGKRGAKDMATDLKEANQSIDRAIQIENTKPK